MLALGRHPPTTPLEEGPWADKALQDGLADLLKNRTLPTLFALAPTPAARIALLRLVPLASALLPSSLLRAAGQDRTLLETCIDQLTDASNGASAAEVRACAACVARVPAAQGPLLDALADALRPDEAPADGPAAPAAVSGRHNTRGVAAITVPRVSRRRALQLLAVLLAEEDCRGAVLAHPAMFEAVLRCVTAEDGPAAAAVAIRMAAHLDRTEPRADGGAPPFLPRAVAAVAHVAVELAGRIEAPRPPRAALGPANANANANAQPAMRNLAAAVEGNGKKRKKAAEKAKDTDAGVAAAAEGASNALAAHMSTCIAALADALALAGGQDPQALSAAVSAAAAATKLAPVPAPLGRLVCALTAASTAAPEPALSVVASFLAAVDADLPSSTLGPLMAAAAALSDKAGGGSAAAAPSLDWLRPLSLSAAVSADPDAEGDAEAKGRKRAMEGASEGLWTQVQALPSAAALLAPLLLKFAHAHMAGADRAVTGALTAAVQLARARKLDAGVRRELASCAAAILEGVDAREAAAQGDGGESAEEAQLQAHALVPANLVKALRTLAL